MTLSALLSSTAYAIPASVPSSAQPGIILRDLEKGRSEMTKPEEVYTIRKEDADGKGLSTEKAFTLDKVILDGSSVYSQDTVNSFSSEYIGKKVSFADLHALSRAITTHYREDGYILSKVILPPQKIKGGVVHMRAIEGHVVDVKIVGTYKDDNNLIRKMAEKIKTSGPANTKKIERYLLLINDLPGISARSVIQPSKTVPGGANVIITIEERKAEGSVSFDNRGSKFIGPYNFTAIGAVNNLFGLHDRTTVRGITTVGTDELRFGDVTHEEQVGSEGQRVIGRFAVTDTHPGGSHSSLDVNGRSYLFDLQTLYPLIRNRQYNVNVLGGFTAINTETKIASASTASDNIRLVHAGGHFDATDSWAGVNQLDLEVAQGVDLFGTSEKGVGRSRTSGEPEFTRENFNVTRLQDIWGPFSVKLTGAGQHSADALWITEQFAIGGSEIGRAYDVGEITGDSGLGGVVELRYTGTTAPSFIESYQLYTYYDGGKVWNNDEGFGEFDSASLASAGFGARFNLKYDVSGYMELDTPLTRGVNSENNSTGNRFFFSLLKRF